MEIIGWHEKDLTTKLVISISLKLKAFFFDFIAKNKELVKVTVLGNLTTSLVIEWVEKSQLPFSHIAQFSYHILRFKIDM